MQLAGPHLAGPGGRTWGGWGGGTPVTACRAEGPLRDGGAGAFHNPHPSFHFLVGIPWGLRGANLAHPICPGLLEWLKLCKPLKIIPLTSEFLENKSADNRIIYKLIEQAPHKFGKIVRKPWKCVANGSAKYCFPGIGALKGCLVLSGACFQIRTQNTATNLGVFLFFLSFLIYLWLFLALGHIAILFGCFCNLQKINQIWILGPRIYHQNTSKIQEKLWRHP